MVDTVDKGDVWCLCTRVRSVRFQVGVEAQHTHKSVLPAFTIELPDGSTYPVSVHGPLSELAVAISIPEPVLNLKYFPSLAR